MDQLLKGYWRRLLSFGCFLLPMLLWGQISKIETDTVRLNYNDTIQLDHSNLVPFTLKIQNLKGDKLPGSDFSFDYSTSKLTIRSSELKDSIWVIQYNYFLSGPEKELGLGNWKAIRDSTIANAMVDVIFEDEENASTLFEESRIRKSGSLTRGLTVGNQRGVSVNSGLRLQLEGDLGNGMKILGAITDENIPIQPDGTTQQLNDFDKVFIKLMKDPVEVTIGDYEINQRGTAFANYYRNVQGLQVAYKEKNTAVQVSGAVAKGKFNTNRIQGKEGVAGPYRLSGQNGERFFFVLAGSEVVYLNGKRMKRGETEDYIIDYNTAEITFTARHVITSITRIVVDFEYNDQFYNRTLFVGQASQTMLDDKLKLRFFYGRDADNPNAPFDDIENFAQVRDSLEAAGDNPQGALTNGVTDVGFSSDPGQVRYLRADTLIDGINYERYIFSKDSAASYKIAFSYLGPNQGFYVRDNSGVNRTVYKWVEPDAQGRPQGEFAPVRTWVLPRELQVTGVQLEYDISEHVKVRHESAISIEDKNRESLIGDEDNMGYAGRTDLQFNKLRLGDSLDMSISMRQQYIQARYTNLDRLYQAEYDRVWNLPSGITRRDERIGMLKMNLDYKRKLSLAWEGGIRNTGRGRQDLRQVYSFRSNWPKWLQGDYKMTVLKNKDESIGRNAQWIRHEGNIFQPIGKKLRVGTEIWIEDREELQADTLTAGSFNFVDLKPYIRATFNKAFTTELSMNYRKEDQFAQGKMRDQSEAYTYNFKTAYQPNPRVRFQQTTSLRDFRVLDTTFLRNGLNNSRLVNSQILGSFRSENRFINLNFVYDAASEQVAKRDLRYVEVNPGQGQYEYLGDLNENGLQDLDEFQLSVNPILANYIRVSIPTRELFPTTKLGLSGRIQLDFRGTIEESKNLWKETFRNIRTNTLIRINQNKNRDSRFQAYLIDIRNILADSNLLNATYNFRQDITFFQNSPKGDLRFTRFENATKLFLSTGSEQRSLSYWGFNQRLNLGTDRSITVDTRVGNKFNEAENFETRNFNIRFLETEPTLNLQLSRKARLSFGYSYKRKNNQTTLVEMQAKVNAHSLISSAKVNLKDRNNLLVRLELASIEQTGSAGFSGDYELREGLQPGFNAIWQGFLTVYVMGNVELGLTYDGRASRGNSTVHTGRVQVRAFF